MKSGFGSRTFKKLGSVSIYGTTIVLMREVMLGHSGRWTPGN